MTIPRFFIHPDWLEQDTVTITGALVHQIRDVLRMVPNDRFLVLDNSGWEYEVQLDTIGKDKVVGKIQRKMLATGEPRTKITLYQAILRGRHFEWVLQKGTEIGIVEFVPIISERCLVSSLDDISASKITRWQRIILEAAEQSHRGRLPRLQSPVLFAQACDQTRRGGLALLPWEEEHHLTLRDLLTQESRVSAKASETRSERISRRPFSIHVLIGPEGGFTQEETNLARRYGIQTVTLGPRILRAETAGLVAATAILYEFGDLGQG